MTTQTHPVAGSSSSGDGRIVAGADGVAAHRLHDLQLAFEGAPIDGGAERAQIVVIADAVEASCARR